MSKVYSQHEKDPDAVRFGQRLAYIREVLGSVLGVNPYCRALTKKNMCNNFFHMNYDQYKKVESGKQVVGITYIKMICKLQTLGVDMQDMFDDIPNWEKVIKDKIINKRSKNLTQFSEIVCAIET
ncbi:MAG: hypothetical protein MJZ28_07590 [Paludibacteraceae bacterium]|nr:hypothetical protein [Bacilli bacterium]MCQ2194798.1 hypothetical protein [Paludibacteraceae bacterium]